MEHGKYPRDPGRVCASREKRGKLRAVLRHIESVVIERSLSVMKQAGMVPDNSTSTEFARPERWRRVIPASLFQGHNMQVINHTERLPANQLSLLKNCIRLAR